MFQVSTMNCPRQITKEILMETEIAAFTAGYLLLRLGVVAGIGYAMYAVLRRRGLFTAQPALARARR
jgi:hypothetical protein